MSLMFCDSYDHYAVTNDKWTNGGGASNNDLTGTLSRTGIGCGVLSGVLAPSYGIASGLGPFYTGCAMNFSSLAGGGRPCSFRGGGNLLCAIHVQANGSIVIQSVASGFQSAESAPGLVAAGVYAYFELSCVLTPAGGSNATVTATARINGFVVLGPVSYNVGFPAIDQIYPEGPGGGATGYIDDFYLCNGLGTRNNGFLGAVRIYAGTPISDSTPLQWATSAGSTHWNLVNEIPPDNAATYVDSNTVGQIDQYIHSNGSPPGGDVILAVQHNLDANIATSGSRQIESCINGVAHAPAATLTTTFHIYTCPYDINPVTGIPWTAADFTALPIGPEVTA